jgi:putative spermidine/putrescine transport system permease protein
VEVARSISRRALRARLQPAGALVAGGLLAFALSFDEIVVTTFTAGAGYKTLPLWFADNFARPNEITTVNVVATFVVIASIIPVWLAQRLTDTTVSVAH